MGAIIYYARPQNTALPRNRVDRVQYLHAPALIQGLWFDSFEFVSFQTAFSRQRTSTWTTGTSTRTSARSRPSRGSASTPYLSSKSRRSTSTSKILTSRKNNFFLLKPNQKCNEKNQFQFSQLSVVE